MPPPVNRSGQMASSATNLQPHTLFHTHTHTHTLQAEPQLSLVVSCSYASLILSLRAAGEQYICATFTCDVGTEIEMMELPFEPAIQLSDIPGHK